MCLRGGCPHPHASSSPRPAAMFKCWSASCKFTTPPPMPVNSIDLRLDFFGVCVGVGVILGTGVSLGIGGGVGSGGGGVELAHSGNTHPSSRRASRCSCVVAATSKRSRACFAPSPPWACPRHAFLSSAMPARNTASPGVPAAPAPSPSVSPYSECVAGEVVV